MTDEIVIPESHWDLSGMPDWEKDRFRVHIPAWELQLRNNIKAEPDPAERFSSFLEKRASGEYPGVGLRLLFIEEPWLTWAKLVEKAINVAEKNQRENIAHGLLSGDSNDDDPSDRFA